MTVQRNRDLSRPIRPFGIVIERPEMGGAIGINSRRIGSHAPAGAVTLRAIRRVEMKSLAGWALDRHSNEALRRSVLLRAVDFEAVRRVVETDERRAVRDRSAQTNAPRRVQRPLQIQNLNAIAIGRQSIRVAAVSTVE